MTGMQTGLPVKQSPPGHEGIQDSPAITADTSAVAARNIVIDFTFYDRNNPLAGPRTINPGFPALFIEKGKDAARADHSRLLKSLKDGDSRNESYKDGDFVLGVLLVSVMLFTVVSATTRNLMPDASRFFLFRGMGDTVKKDRKVLLGWQSTLLNLSAFMVLALFIYSSAQSYSVMPEGMSPLLFWLAALGAIVTAITLRHMICLITGNLSSQSPLFSEYLMIIYYSYRFSALFLAVLTLIMNYTVFLPPEVYVIPGAVIFALIYIFRIIRLILIFINEGVSILYLILYLCALEFLPVLICAKYFTGLV